jgi:hypothetical protein
MLMRVLYAPADEGFMKADFTSPSCAAALECGMRGGWAGQRTRAGLAALWAAAALADPQRVTWTFDEAPAGRAPVGFELVSTGEAGEGRWEVWRDGRNLLLAQLAHAARARGARMAIAREPSLRDVSLSVRFRGVDGERAAGIVWRYADQGHYYLARVNLSEQEVDLYKVVGGNRSRLGGEDDLELDPAAWHTLKVEHRGEHIRVWLDGIPVDRARDRTLDAAGRVGVWTTAESAAWFDDLTVAEPRADKR